MASSNELTESEVLHIFGLKSPEYKAEKKYNTNAANAESKKHNTQLYEWVIKKKNGDKYVEIPKNQYRIKVGEAVNACAVKGDNGIIIIRPMELSKLAKRDNTILSINNDNNIEEKTEISYDNEDFGGETKYFVSGYGGHDEEIIKHISFAKLCLLKECYEFLGEVF